MLVIQTISYDTDHKICFNSTLRIYTENNLHDLRSKVLKARLSLAIQFQEDCGLRTDLDLVTTLGGEQWDRGHFLHQLLRQLEVGGYGEPLPAQHSLLVFIHPLEKLESYKHSCL